MRVYAAPPDAKKWLRRSQPGIPKAARLISERTTESPGMGLWCRGRTRGDGATRRDPRPTRAQSVSAFAKRVCRPASWSRSSGGCRAGNRAASAAPAQVSARSAAVRICRGVLARLRRRQRHRGVDDGLGRVLAVHQITADGLADDSSYPGVASGECRAAGDADAVRLEVVCAAGADRGGEWSSCRESYDHQYD